MNKKRPIGLFSLFFCIFVLQYLAINGDDYMRKSKYDDLGKIDDYYEDDGDARFYSVENDLSDVSYEDFNKPTKVVVEDDDDEEKVVVTKTVKKKKTSSAYSRITDNEELIDFLAIFWIWFRRIGIIIAVILIAYFITKGLFKDLFMYILLLVGSFFFGFGFMAVLTSLLDNR